jgi:hypothetical protein
VNVRGALRWVTGDGLLLVALAAAWFLILWGLAKASGLCQLIVGLEVRAKIGAAIIGVLFLLVPTGLVFWWIIRTWPARPRPPASAAPPVGSEASAWLAMGGAIISVAVALIFVTGGFTLWTSIVGFILATYIGTFLNEYGGTYLGHLARSEIIVIPYLLIVAPFVELLIGYIGGPDKPFITMCNGDSEFADNCTADDWGRLTIKWSDFIFLLLFFIAFGLHLRFAHYLPAWLGGPKPKQGQTR